MRFTFAVFAIAAITQAAYLPDVDYYSEITDSDQASPDVTQEPKTGTTTTTPPPATTTPDKAKTDPATPTTPKTDDGKKPSGVDADPAVQQAKKAKETLDSADTSEPSKLVSNSFTTLESEIDQKITRQRKSVSDAVANVSDLNKQADAKIGEAKKAVEKKAKAGQDKTQADNEYSAQVQVVEQAAKKAEEQATANKDARAAKKKTVEAQVKASASVNDLTDALEAALKAKSEAQQFGVDRQRLIDYTLKEAAKLAAGTSAETVALEQIAKDAVKNG